MIVKLGSEGGKKDVMKRKGGLRERKIWIGDDMTWKESRWRFRETVRAEERKGAKV